MMPRIPTLSERLARARAPRPPEPATEPEPSSTRPKSRQGVVPITVYVPPAARRALRQAALSGGTTLHALMLEAVREYMRARGLPMV